MVCWLSGVGFILYVNGLDGFISIGGSGSNVIGAEGKLIASNNFKTMHASHLSLFSHDMLGMIYTQIFVHIFGKMYVSMVKELLVFDHNCQIY